MNKYDFFNLSAIEFIYKTDRSSKISGCSEIEIANLENKYKVCIPISLKSYLKYFGKSISFYGSKRAHGFLSFADLTYTIKTFRGSDTFDLIKEEWKSRINFLPILYDRENDFLYFIDSNLENSKWHHSYDTESADTMYKGKITIIDHVRSLIKLHIRQAHRNQTKFLDFSGIKWLDFYVSTDSLFLDTGKFSNIATEAEKKSGDIWSYERYEQERIKYLIKNGYVPAAPQVYDPFESV